MNRDSQIMTLDERRALVAAKRASGEPLDFNDRLVEGTLPADLGNESTPFRWNARLGRAELWTGKGEPHETWWSEAGPGEMTDDERFDDDYAPMDRAANSNSPAVADRRRPARRAQVACRRRHPRRGEDPRAGRSPGPLHLA